MNKNLLEEIDYLKQKIPFIVKMVFSRCGGACNQDYITTPEVFDKFVERYKTAYNSKWTFDFNPTVYSGTAKQLLNTIFDICQKDDDYRLLVNGYELFYLDEETIFPKLHYFKNEPKLEIIHVKNDCDFEAFMPDANNQITPGSY